MRWSRYRPGTRLSMPTFGSQLRPSAGFRAGAETDRRLLRGSDYRQYSRSTTAVAQRRHCARPDRCCRRRRPPGHHHNRRERPRPERVASGPELRPADRGRCTATGRCRCQSLLGSTSTPRPTATEFAAVEQAPHRDRAHRPREGAESHRAVQYLRSSTPRALSVQRFLSASTMPPHTATPTTYFSPRPGRTL